MNRSEPRLVAGCLLAVVVPATVLHFTAGDDRHAAGLTAAPFAWPRLLVAHFVTALPLGLIVAGWVRSLPAVNEAARALWVVVGLGLAGLTALVCPGIGDVVGGGGFGAVPLLVLRAALCVGLVLPWCVWATDPPGGDQRRTHPGVLFGVGLGLATVPCAMYAETVTAARTASAEEWVTADRLVRAERVLAGLCELGSDRPVVGKPPHEVRRRLRKEIDGLGRAAGSPLPASAPLAARFARAEVLVRLDRLAEAADLLRPLAPTSPVATLLLAAVDRDLGRWAESEAECESVLERLLPKAETDAKAGENCRLAFEGMAESASADNRPADAERALRRGLEALPKEAAHFHFLLGRHYHNCGRPRLAVEHLRTAADLDPTQYQGPAERLIQHINTSTPACLPRRSLKYSAPQTDRIVPTTRARRERPRRAGQSPARAERPLA